MKRTNLAWIYENRKTILNFGTTPPIEDGLHGEAHMLWDDVHLHVMPLHGRKDKPTRVELVNAQGIWEGLVLNALDEFDRYDKGSLTEAVCQFVTAAASLLVRDGRSLYEVVQGPHHPDSPGIRQFAFVYFPSGQVRRHFGSYVQEGTVQLWNQPKRLHKVLLRREEVFEIRLPAWLGDTHTQEQLLRTLGVLTPLSVRWPFERIALGNQRVAFDFSRHKRDTNIRLARATREWGWNARDAWREETLEYYQVYRFLRFHETLARMREFILGALNHKLAKMGCTGKLVYKGLPTSKDIQHLEVELGKGRTDFDQVIKTVYGP